MTITSVGFSCARVAPELEREPQHGELLAAALRVPHDAAAVFGLAPLLAARATALFTAPNCW